MVIETFKIFLVLFLAFVFASVFGVCSVNAQNTGLVLGVTKKCDIQYSGDNCIAELKITNNIGKVFDGQAFLHIDYQGACKNGYFDGEGIYARFSINNIDWMNFSGWKNGTAEVLGFNVAQGDTQAKLKIETVPSLCPGEYIFSLELQGALPVLIGGGGGGFLLNTAKKVGDINGDGAVNELDFSVIMAQWGQKGSGLSGDLDKNGIIDELDLSLLMANWG